MSPLSDSTKAIFLEFPVLLLCPQYQIPQLEKLDHVDV